MHLSNSPFNYLKTTKQIKVGLNIFFFFINFQLLFLFVPFHIFLLKNDRNGIFCLIMTICVSRSELMLFNLYFIQRYQIISYVLFLCLFVFVLVFVFCCFFLLTTWKKNYNIEVNCIYKMYV